MGNISRLAAIIILILTAGRLSAQPHGIEVPRQSNTDLLITELPADSPGTMQLQRVFPQLTFQKQVLVLEAPDPSNRLFVVSQTGRIYTFPNSADPSPAQVSTFLDIADRTWDSGERGLLGMAFDPDYATNGIFYVSYVTYGGNGISRVSRFVNSNPASSTVDSSASNETIIISVTQDFSNHNGGMIAFGPDDMLYFGLGDGGSANDPNNRGQDTRNLLGSMLRLDVRGTPDQGKNYAIPPDNPFVGGTGPAGAATREEIFAYGLRNPWRFCFDPLQGYLIAADVGQGAREEVDHIVSGGNYGWRVVEGTRCNFPAEGCNNPDFTPPIAEYTHAEGNSITGGFVYYGSAVPALYGTYIYADYGSTRIWGIRYDGNSATAPTVLVSSAGFGITGFGQDATGEVYVLDYGFSGNGGIYVLRPTSPVASNFPNRLSDLPALLAAADGSGHTVPGVIPYEPSAKLWSDGTHKERYLALPGLDQAIFTLTGGWGFPEETVIIKNFLLPLDERAPEATLQRIETRLLYLKNGAWYGFSYEWNDAETDGQLLTGSKNRSFTVIGSDGQPFDYTWYYPGRTDCNICHTAVTNHVLGLSTPQMNYDFQYPASGVTDNQLRTLDYISVFEEPLPAPPDQLPRMPDPADTTWSLEQRARAYLAANCAMCHQPGAPNPTTIDLRWETPTSATNLVSVAPTYGDLGIPNASLIAPGDPQRSVLLQRMLSLDDNRMPPIASTRIDNFATDLIEQWILSLGPTSAEAWFLY